MCQSIKSNAFRTLIATLERPSLVPSIPTPSPYPFAEEEMIARYGLRYLTLNEQAVFPGLRLVLTVFKARLTKPPAILPRTRVGWVVWVAETYPANYLVRMPGGTILLAPYHQMTWTAVADDAPITTLATVKNEEQQQRWRMSVRRGIQQSLII
jgi:hypothetical protein